MREMSNKGLGATSVTDSDGRVLGVFTDWRFAPFD